MTLSQVVSQGSRTFWEAAGCDGRVVGRLGYFLPLQALGGLANRPQVTKLYTAGPRLAGFAFSWLITKSRTTPHTHSLLLAAPVRASSIIPAPSVSSCNDKESRAQNTLVHPFPLLITKAALPLPASAPAFAILSLPVTDVRQSLQ